MSSIDKSAMFGPVSFPEVQQPHSFNFFDDPEQVICVLCPTEFTIPENSPALFQHLFNEHQLVIAEAEKIVSLKSYLTFWRLRFASKPIEEYCATLTMDAQDVTQKHYLLSDSLPEDKELRDGLQKLRLELVLEWQARERDQKDWCRGCLFCRHQVCGTRAEYLDHLAIQHNLQLGRANNLVFVDKLLDKLQEKMDQLRCIFCNKLFPERTVLKEHMRKKQHKRVNPDDASYDRYFIVNYLEPGRNWAAIQEEVDEPDREPPAADWSDWSEETVEPPVVCLFCPESDQSHDAVLKHMVDAHQFDYRSAVRGLDFYQQVKAVNFVRREVLRGACPECGAEPESTLASHLAAAGHCTLPASHRWNHPEYFFPTYENDSFLCHLEDPEEAMESVEAATEEMSLSSGEH